MEENTLVEFSGRAGVCDSRHSSANINRAINACIGSWTYSAASCAASSSAAFFSTSSTM